MLNNSKPISRPYTGAIPGGSNNDTGSAINPLHDGSLAATVDLPEFPLIASRLSMGFNWTGTPTGTLKLQHSFDGGTTWYDTPGASTEFTAQPAGGVGSVTTNWSNVPGSMARIVYTRASGTGTLTSWQAQGPA